jgi:hypothetical protein
MTTVELEGQTTVYDALRPKRGAYDSAAAHDQFETIRAAVEAGTSVRKAVKRLGTSDQWVYRYLRANPARRSEWERAVAICTELLLSAVRVTEHGYAMYDAGRCRCEVCRRANRERSGAIRRRLTYVEPCPKCGAEVAEPCRTVAKDGRHVPCRERRINARSDRRRRPS